MAAPLDTQHVRNVGEFFSQHYLDAVLGEDLAAVFKRWRAAARAGGTRTPTQRLAALSEGYFRAMAEVRGTSWADRARRSRAFHSRLLLALGHERETTRVALADGSELTLARAESVDGRPYLWIGEAALPESEDRASPFDSAPLDDEAGQRTWKELLDGCLFRQEQAPRWLLLLAGPDVLLLEREKWGEGRYLHVELGAMLGHRAPTSLRAAAGLLHRDVLLPSSGRSVLDGLDDRSHKHAFAASTELKAGVQKAIELLGNEALHYRRTTLARARTSATSELAKRLSEECITYLYRLLMLFFVEARGGALGVVPMQAEAYRDGLSLESLRELELVPLRTPAAQNGYYFHHSLERLFMTTLHGWPRQAETGPRVRAGGEAPGAIALKVASQRGPLFDPARTPILSGVKFRNHVLQAVIRLLSLSPERGRAKPRGRISYATLGINQLGSVYEGLLSYSGLIAEESLYEVQRPRDRHGERGRVYFVPASRAGDYRAEEFRLDTRGERIRHEKGAFFFRLAGRARQRSASFYTPETLTRCLTEYTLEERLRGLRADELLALTICEPAMGSGAFLGEAVSQLATAYLERKQLELGARIPADEYAVEHARARYHFVVHNSYGVDLNPLAAELGKVSLWLAVLQSGVEAPSLGARLRVGNSLIGARREVYAPEELTGRSGQQAERVSWLERPPTRVKPGEPRPKGHVYHFLLPGGGMAPYERDRVVSRLCPEEIKALRTWRRAMKRPYQPAEVKRLQAICEHVDALWEAHRTTRRRALARLRQPIVVWGQRAPAGAWARWKPPEECERIVEELTRPGSPYARLRAVMDLWCELWTWPIERARELPSRESWMTRVEDLLADRRRAPERVAGGYLHWELEFCEVFEERGGFDVIVGNPPWIKLLWREAGVLGELQPALELRKHSAKQIADERARVLTDARARTKYLAAFCHDVGSQGFLTSAQNYPLLVGVQTNLYKCFIALASRVLAPQGAAGLIHQKGVFDDPKGGALRRHLCGRLALYLHFINKLRLFSEIKDEKHYELTVYRGRPRVAPRFVSISNLLHPATIDASLAHDGAGPVPGIKDERGSWDLRPHASRVVIVDEESLRLFARLYDKPGTSPREARLPVIHSRELLAVLRRFADAPRMLGGRDDYFCTEHFHETNQQKDGTIRRAVRRPRGPDEWIVSGPHIYVGAPFNKTPNAGCRNNQDYSAVDLTQIADDYLPRTNYLPACAPAEYAARTPTWRGELVTRRYRYVNRRMVSSTGERTLTPAIIPPGAAHTDLVFSVSFLQQRTLLQVAGMWASLPVDFFVKTTGKGDARADVLSQLPLPEERWVDAIVTRALRLNCLTRHYASLWDSNLPEELLASAKGDRRTEGWERAPREWSREAPLRTAYGRRQALVELDALAALSLGMTKEELMLVYRVQFPVLRQYEAETYYDQRGKIVFTVNRGLAGVGVTRRQWREIKEAGEGEGLPGWAKDEGGAFVPPFDRCDREADMSEAYTYFEERIGATK